MMMGIRVEDFTEQLMDDAAFLTVHPMYFVFLVFLPYFYFCCFFFLTKGKGTATPPFSASPGTGP